MEQNNFSYAKRKIFAIPVLLFVITLIGLMSAAQTIIYDNYNNGIINQSLWKNYSTYTGSCINNATVSIGNYIEIQSNSTANPGTGDVTLIAYSLPIFNNINSINFSINFSIEQYAITEGAGSDMSRRAISNLSIFGNSINTISRSGVPAGTTSDIANYTVIKNYLYSNNYTVYKNGAVLTSIAALNNNNNITGHVFSQHDTEGGATGIFRIHMINYTYVNNSIIYTSPVYETSSQYFAVITQFNNTIYPNAYAYLNYSGTIYTTNIIKTINGLDIIFNTNIDIPTVSASRNYTFSWILYSNLSTIQNSIETNQTVNPIAFSICGGTGGNVPFINMVYLDENSLSPVNLSIMSSSWNYWLGNGTTFKSYFYNNVGTTAPNNSFCFSPASTPSSFLYTNVAYQYGLTGIYPTRTFNTITPPYLTLTNFSTNVSLYTLSFVESGSITIQVVDVSSANVIAGAEVSIQRNIGGSLVTIFNGLTDSAGTVNVYLSTTNTYIITARKQGCGVNTQSVVPVGSYNMQLSCASNAPLYNSSIQGVIYQRGPADGVNNEIGFINYSYYVFSSTKPIYQVKFLLKDEQRTILATNETNVSSGFSYCNSTSCLLTITYYTSSGDDIRGSYYINLGTAINNTGYILLEGDAHWRFITINSNNSNSGVTRFADHFNQFFYQWEADGNCRAYLDQASCSGSGFCKWINNTGYSNIVTLCVLKDNYNKAEFSRIILIFFGMVTVLFIIGKTTGYEMTNPGSFVMFMSGAIIIMSMLGFFRFNGLTPNRFLDQYIYATICTMFSIGYNISIIRRYSA